MSDSSFDSDENEVPAIHLSSPNLLHRTSSPPLVRASTAPAIVEPIAVDPVLGHSLNGHGHEENEKDKEKEHRHEPEKHSSEHKSHERKKKRIHLSRKSQPQPQLKTAFNSGFDPAEYEKNGSVFGVNSFNQPPRWGATQPSPPFKDRNIQWISQQQSRHQPPQFSYDPDIFGISTSSPVIRELGDDKDEIIFPPLDSPLRRRRFSNTVTDDNIRKISGDERDFLANFRIPEDSKDKPKEKQSRSFTKILKDISPAIYVAAMSIAFIVVHQKESLEQYLNQVVQILFSCITNLALGGGVLAVVLLILRILTSSTVGLFSSSADKKKTDKQKSDNSKPSKSKHDSDLDVLRQSMLNDSIFRRPSGAPNGSYMHTLPTSPLDSSNPRPFGFRSYSNPVLNGNSYPPQPPWGRPQGPQQASSFSPNSMPPMMSMGIPPTPTGTLPGSIPPAGHFYRGSVDIRPPQRPPIVQIPITNEYSEYPLPDISPINGQYEYPEVYDPMTKIRRHSTMNNEPPFPDYYLDETPIQEVVDKDKRTTFSNPVKVIFKRREPGQESPSLANSPLPPQSNQEQPSLFTDNFASKPYGPPPRRYRGINV